MTYDIVLTSIAEADLHRLDSAVARRVINKLQWLAENIETIRLETLTGSWPGVFKGTIACFTLVKQQNGG